MKGLILMLRALLSPAHYRNVKLDLSERISEGGLLMASESPQRKSKVLLEKKRKKENPFYLKGP